MLQYGLSFVAGTLSTLSPCVLPALPLIAGGAAQEHRLGPAAVAGGLVFSSTLLGFLLASFGPWIGVSPEDIQKAAAVFLVLIGIVLLSSKLQALFSQGLARFTQRAGNNLQSKAFKGLWGQFVLGCTIGAVWSPCAGPTLGAAIGLASQEGSRVTAFTMMLLFGVGTALPLLLISYGLRQQFLKYRQRIGTWALKAKPIFGIVLLAFGTLLLTGLQKTIEARLLEWLPGSWLELITSI